MRFGKLLFTMVTIPLLLLHVNYIKTSESSSLINQMCHYTIGFCPFNTCLKSDRFPTFPFSLKEESMTVQNFSRSTFYHFRNVTLTEVKYDLQITLCEGSCEIDYNVLEMAVVGSGVLRIECPREDDSNTMTKDYILVIKFTY